MWIFTETGFVSAVRKDEYPDVLTVRSRDRKSLESLAKLAAVEIAQSPKGDYPYRLFVSADLFGQWAVEQIMGLDYNNFKNQIAQTRGADYAYALHDVWLAMLQTEDAESRKKAGVNASN